MAITDQVKMYWRFAHDIRGFLDKPMTLEMSRQVIRRRLQQRQQNLLMMVRKTVYHNSNSPYLKLLENAGADSDREY